MKHNKTKGKSTISTGGPKLGNEERMNVNSRLHPVKVKFNADANEYQLRIKELAEVNEDLNNYFSYSINPQLYVDRGLILRKFTPSAIPQINLKVSDIGTLLIDLNAAIDFSQFILDIMRVVSSSINLTKEVQTLDGRWFQVRGIPFYKKDDNLIHGAIITFNDITEIKKVQVKLSRINQDHNTFIHTVSHDLKGPLGNLDLIISLLKESSEIQSNDSKQLIGLLEKSTANLNHIIYELTDIAKTESEIDVQEFVNIQALMDEVELSLKDQLLNSGAVIRMDLKVSTIQFSKKNLRSILSNLLSNAIKYKSPNRALEITIRSEKKNEFTLLSIEDNGLGISDDKKDIIFGAYKRAHNHVEGSGVGLYLVKKAITNADGDIEVESEVGKGSIFNLYFRNNHTIEETINVIGI